MGDTGQDGSTRAGPGPESGRTTSFRTLLACSQSLCKEMTPMGSRPDPKCQTNPSRYCTSPKRYGWMAAATYQPGERYMDELRQGTAGWWWEWLEGLGTVGSMGNGPRRASWAALAQLPFWSDCLVCRRRIPRVLGLCEGGCPLPGAPADHGVDRPISSPQGRSRAQAGCEVPAKGAKWAKWAKWAVSCIRAGDAYLKDGYVVCLRGCWSYHDQGFDR